MGNKAKHIMHIKRFEDDGVIYHATEVKNGEIEMIADDRMLYRCGCGKGETFTIGIYPSRAASCPGCGKRHFCHQAGAEVYQVVEDSGAQSLL